MAKPKEIRKTMTRTGLVGELERLAECFWGDDKAESAPGNWAVDVSSLLERVYRDAVEASPREEIDKIVLLEADRAEKARRLTGLGGGPSEGVDGCAADGDTAELPPRGDPLFERYQLFMLRHVAALEFSKLVLAFFKPCFDGGVLGFEEPDFVAAKKRAEALKWLVSRIEMLEDGNDEFDTHDVILAYSRMTGD